MNVAGSGEVEEVTVTIKKKKKKEPADQWLKGELYQILYTASDGNTYFETWVGALASDKIFKCLNNTLFLWMAESCYFNIEAGTIKKNLTEYT